jgi:diguanylate cyclase (GGDEF)-like protein/PAS domain S-box-containing protein
MISNEKNKLTILIVDDTPANVDLLRAILSPEYAIMTASRGSEALDIARKSPLDLIMLDIKMPEMDGYDVCRALKADPATKKIPVIFVTSLLLPGDETLGFEVGCVDFITKPVIDKIVRTRVKTQLALQETQNKLEEWNQKLEVHQIELKKQNEELRRVQAELELSRNKYSGLYDAAPIGYFTFDGQGVIREANLTGACLLGIERQLLARVPFNIFIADADGREIFSQHLNNVLQKQVMQRCEIRLSAKDGTVIYGKLQSVIQESVENIEGYILCSIVDDTVGKQLESKIQDAREYAENIVETVSKPLVVLDSDLKILTANHNFYESFDVTPEETIGKFIYDLGNRQWDIPKLRVLFEEILPLDTVFNNYEVEHDFPGIGRRTIMLNARQIFRKNIGLHMILLAMDDISEQRRLKAERSQLAMIVESSHDGIFSVSLSDVITSWNRGAENIFGYSADEIIGSQIFRIIPEELYDERSNLLQTVLRGKRIDHFETTRIRKDGLRIYVSITASPLLNADGEIFGNSVIARDVTKRRKLEEIIKHQAHHDNLTDLPNRQLFMDFINLGLAQAQRHKKKLALLFLDLNGFKQVNDTLGHNCGDRLLQEVARRLKTSVRATDTVARLGGDEFTVLMPDLAHTDDVSIVLKKILGVFETPFILDGVTVDTTASIGISMFPDDGDCSEELMKKADIAMYESKKSGGNSYRFNNAEINARTIAALALHLNNGGQPANNTD